MQSYACRCKMQNAGTGCRGELGSFGADWPELTNLQTTTLQHLVGDGRDRIQPAEPIGRAQRSKAGLC